MLNNFISFSQDRQQAYKALQQFAENYLGRPLKNFESYELQAWADNLSSHGPAVDAAMLHPLQAQRQRPIQTSDDIINTGIRHTRRSIEQSMQHLNGLLKNNQYSNIQHTESFQSAVKPASSSVLPVVPISSSDLIVSSIENLLNELNLGVQREISSISQLLQETLQVFRSLLPSTTNKEVEVPPSTEGSSNTKD